MTSFGTEILRKELFQPPPIQVLNEDAPGFAFLAPDGARRMPAQLWNGRRTDAAPLRYVIYFHGNATNVGELAPYAREWSRELQARLLLPEYPGYAPGVGDEPARTNPSDMWSIARVGPAAVQYAQQWISEQSDASEWQLFIVGRSLGAVPALAGALRAASATLSGVILFSAFASARELVKDYTFSLGSAFVADRMRNVDAVRALVAPLLIVHGTADTLVAPRHARLLRNAAQEAVPLTVKLLDGATHNSYLPSWPTLVDLNELSSQAQELRAQASAADTQSSE